MKNLRHLFATLALAACAWIATPAHAGALTDYIENKLVDWLLRGQTFTPPATNIVVAFPFFRSGLVGVQVAPRPCEYQR
jgi:hypothetical protein